MKRAGAVSSDLGGAVLSPSETITTNHGVVLKNMSEYRSWYQPVHWVLAHHGLHAF
ncbi:hypothetical protein [Streptomyces cupreus]|uniref:Uncharacterized protein n=1 Tax=Streptomyces cupreus TaxID=2759956 RepID=A0A7X1JEC9_9ACTN|nr:hypothetical protein [Streptomyces cupreus]MBC2908267.1 hypothetical protein [Streptomyces cupreus]